MEQRALGRTGLTVSALGFGCGAVGGLMVKGTAAEQERAVGTALDAGVTYFDTAASYGDGVSEQSLGRALAALGAWPRVVVGTKVRVPDGVDRRAAIRQSLEASLSRLGRDAVDVFHLHNPLAIRGGGSARALGVDEVLGEVARGFEDVLRAGLTRHVGLTGLGDTQALQEAVQGEPFETVQAYFNVLNPSAGYAGKTHGQQDFGGLIDTAANAGRGVIVIRVLAAGAAAATTERADHAGDPGGVLAGPATFETQVDQARQLEPLVRELGLEGTVELAFRFGLAKAGVSTVLVGFSHQAHLESALRWAERGPLPADAVERVLQVRPSTGSGRTEST